MDDVIPCGEGLKIIENHGLSLRDACERLRYEFCKQNLRAWAYCQSTEYNTGRERERVWREIGPFELFLDLQKCPVDFDGEIYWTAGSHYINGSWRYGRFRISQAIHPDEIFDGRRIYLQTESGIEYTELHFAQPDIEAICLHLCGGGQQKKGGKPGFADREEVMDLLISTYKTTPHLFRDDEGVVTLKLLSKWVLEKIGEARSQSQVERYVRNIHAELRSAIPGQRFNFSQNQ